MPRQWSAAGRRAVLVTVLFGFAALPSRGQEPDRPATPRPAEAESLTPTSLQPGGGTPESPQPGTPQLAPEPAPPGPEPLLRQSLLTYTFLPGGGARGFQVNDIEANATFALPLTEGASPLLLTPALAGHFWGGPRSEDFPGRPDLPPRVYDASLDVGWRPRLARWLFADVGVTPGIYADFHSVTAQSFRPRGRAIGVVAFSPQFQVAAGVLYVNRLHVQLLPAGGIIWSPDPDTRCELLFPQPKIARRLTTVGSIQWWGYLLGEFGGGTWTVRRAGGADDLADYSDLRLLAGLEWVNAAGLKGRFEAGYVFKRLIQYGSATPELKPDSTVVLRAGVSF